LINNVLDLSKIESGKMDIRARSFDLYRMVQGLGEMFEVRARQKGLTLTVDHALDVPQYIKTDDGKLRQVLINLLGNAIKFTHTGSVTLRVSVANRDAGRQELDSQHCSLLFSVQDTGIGIAPEDLAHIFKPFAQLQSGNLSQQGTGLGLAISHQHVELLGGRLEVKSEVGVGSTFSVEIPVLGGAAADAPTSPKKVVGIVPGQSVENGGPFRILIAEDVDVNRRFLVKLLLSYGFEVREAVNGEEALSIWKDWQPHLIFMDLRMPVLDGLEVTRRIKATPQAQKTVIIIVTANVFEGDRDAVLMQGCDDFIRKPIRESQIFQALQKHLGIQFVYEPVLPKTPKLGRFIPSNSGRALNLSDDWKKRMRQAVTEADIHKMQDLIKEIETPFPDFSRTLTQMVYDFDYDGICALIDSL
jgi:CheY-like chemotaxis protein